MIEAKLKLWNEFARAHDILARSTPLFAQADDGRVETFLYGRGSHARRLLLRSPKMEAHLIQAVNEAVSSSSDGVLYMMFREGGSSGVVPLYIGRAGRIGKKGGLSQNLQRIETNTANFGRWGYNYAYHMGDLSAVVLGHPSRAIPKYRSWSTALFHEVPSSEPRLKFPVRFWCTKWSASSQNIWTDFGPCSLSFIEYLLIGVASSLFPNDLLNREGVNFDEISGA